MTDNIENTYKSRLSSTKHTSPYITELEGATVTYLNGADISDHIRGTNADVIRGYDNTAYYEETKELEKALRADYRSVVSNFEVKKKKVFNPFRLEE